MRYPCDHAMTDTSRDYRRRSGLAFAHALTLHLTACIGCAATSTDNLDKDVEPSEKQTLNVGRLVDYVYNPNLSDRELARMELASRWLSVSLSGAKDSFVCPNVLFGTLTRAQFEEAGNAAEEPDSTLPLESAQCIFPIALPGDVHQPFSVAVARLTGIVLYAQYIARGGSSEDEARRRACAGAFASWPALIVAINSTLDSCDLERCTVELAQHNGRVTIQRSEVSNVRDAIQDLIENKACFRAEWN